MESKKHGDYLLYLQQSLSDERKRIHCSSYTSKLLDVLVDMSFCHKLYRWRHLSEVILDYKNRKKKYCDYFHRVLNNYIRVDGTSISVPFTSKYLETDFKFLNIKIQKDKPKYCHISLEEFVENIQADRCDFEKSVFPITTRVYLSKRKLFDLPKEESDIYKIVEIWDTKRDMTNGKAYAVLKELQLLMASIKEELDPTLQFLSIKGVKIYCNFFELLNRKKMDHSYLTRTASERLQKKRDRFYDILYSKPEFQNDILIKKLVKEKNDIFDQLSSCCTNLKEYDKECLACMRQYRMEKLGMDHFFDTYATEFLEHIDDGFRMYFLRLFFEIPYKNDETNDDAIIIDNLRSKKWSNKLVYDTLKNCEDALYKKDESKSVYFIQDERLFPILKEYMRNLCRIVRYDESPILFGVYTYGRFLFYITYKNCEIKSQFEIPNTEKLRHMKRNRDDFDSTVCKICDKITKVALPKGRCITCCDTSKKRPLCKVPVDWQKEIRKRFKSCTYCCMPMTDETYTCFEYNHKNPNLKIVEISRLILLKEAGYDADDLFYHEIDKVELICYDCHKWVTINKVYN